MGIFYLMPIHEDGFKEIVESVKGTK